MTDETARGSALLFMDTETLGLGYNAPIWEWAAIRREPTGEEQRFHLHIGHDPTGWVDLMPEEFQVDYLKRFANMKGVKVVSPKHAMLVVQQASRERAHVVGAVPSFDVQRLERMGRITGIEPEWHYHLIDVENLAVGWLAGQDALMPPPWKSDELSRALGVNPEDFARHTAMGDVEWARAQYDVVMGWQK